MSFTVNPDKEAVIQSIGSALRAAVQQRALERFIQEVPVLERRAKYRAKTALPGGAAFAKLADETPCVIINMSAHGACIAFAPGTDIPRIFELRIGRDPTHQTARIVWRRTNTVGVAFLAPRAVPDVLP